jgi:hypothetical protein
MNTSLLIGAPTHRRWMSALGSPRRVALVAAAAVALVAAPLTAKAATSPTFYNDYLTATVTGTSVTVTTLVSASKTVTVDTLGVCIYGDSVPDFTARTKVRMPAWRDIAYTATTRLAAGTYTARACFQVGGLGYSSVGPRTTFTVAGTTSPPVVPPTPTPTPTPTASPAPTTGVDPSGQAMPTVVKPGFRRVSSVNFATSAPAGGVARSVGDNLPYSGVITPYPDGWTDNFGGTYRFGTQASVSGGTLKVAVGSPGGVNTGAAWTWLNPETGWGFTYGAVEQRARVTGDLGGFGSASLLWPDSNVWGEGEIDYPEGDFGGTTNAFHHALGADPGVNASVFSTDVTWTDWHTYRIEWMPAGTEYFIDGRSIGRNTNSTPTTYHHWVTQIGRHGAAVDTAKSGTYEVDWAVIDVAS